MCRRAVQLRWIRTILRTCGSGWTASARLATSCWRSRTTPTSPTVACIRPRSTSMGGRSIAAYAEDRMRNEPLIEIKQTKGQSETHPAALAQRRVRRLQIWSILLGDPTGPHSAYRRQLRPPGAEGRARPGGHQGLQSLQVRLRRRFRLARHRRPLTARTTTSAPSALWTEASRRACRASSSPASTCARSNPPA